MLLSSLAESSERESAAHERDRTALEWQSILRSRLPLAESIRLTCHAHARECAHRGCSFMQVIARLSNMIHIVRLSVQNCEAQREYAQVRASVRARARAYICIYITCMYILTWCALPCAHVQHF